MLKTKGVFLTLMSIFGVPLLVGVSLLFKPESYVTKTTVVDNIDYVFKGTFKKIINNGRKGYSVKYINAFNPKQNQLNMLEISYDCNVTLKYNETFQIKIIELYYNTGKRKFKQDMSKIC